MIAVFLDRLVLLQPRAYLITFFTWSLRLWEAWCFGCSLDTVDRVPGLLADLPTLDRWHMVDAMGYIILSQGYVWSGLEPGGVFYPCLL